MAAATATHQNSTGPGRGLSGRCEISSVTRIWSPCRKVWARARNDARGEKEAGEIGVGRNGQADRRTGEQALTGRSG